MLRVQALMIFPDHGQRIYNEIIWESICRPGENLELMRNVRFLQSFLHMTSHSDLHIAFDNIFSGWCFSGPRLVIRAVPMRGAWQFGPADDDPRISWSIVVETISCARTFTCEMIQACLNKVAKDIHAPTYHCIAYFRHTHTHWCCK